MSNIKMSDTFTGKVKRQLYDGESVLADNVYFELIDNDQLDAMAYAVNSHDTLTTKVAELEAALEELSTMISNNYQGFGDSDLNAAFDLVNKALEDKS
tara:strand:- start:6195 stop:6488 length:294 start_codon:yes stop_codon:yes gene_type:complete